MTGGVIIPNLTENESETTALVNKNVTTLGSPPLVRSNIRYLIVLFVQKFFLLLF